MKYFIFSLLFISVLSYTRVSDYLRPDPAPLPITEHLDYHTNNEIAELERKILWLNINVYEVLDVRVYGVDFVVSRLPDVYSAEALGYKKLGIRAFHDLATELLNRGLILPNRVARRIDGLSNGFQNKPVPEEIILSQGNGVKEVKSDSIDDILRNKYGVSDFSDLETNPSCSSVLSAITKSELYSDGTMMYAFVTTTSPPIQSDGLPKILSRPGVNSTMFRFRKFGSTTTKAIITSIGVDDARSNGIQIPTSPASDGWRSDLISIQRFSGLSGCVAKHDETITFDINVPDVARLIVYRVGSQDWSSGVSVIGEGGSVTPCADCPTSGWWTVQSKYTSSFIVFSGCDQPKNPANGFYGNCASTPTGGTCVLTCSTSYTKSDDAVCNNGTWTTPTCMFDISCQSPPSNPINGTYSACANTPSGNTCPLQCASGNKKSGDATCTRGVWDSQFCTATTCPVTHTAVEVPVSYYSDSNCTNAVRVVYMPVRLNKTDCFCWSDVNEASLSNIGCNQVTRTLTWTQWGTYSCRGGPNPSGTAISITAGQCIRNPSTSDTPYMMIPIASMTC